MNRYVSESTIIRLLRGKGVNVQPCSSCIVDDEYGYQLLDYDLGKDRWTELTCTTGTALANYRRQQNKQPGDADNTTVLA